jgi:tight adherence protein B
MNPTLITVSTFVAASLLAVSLGSLAYDYFFRYRMTVRERVRDICRESEEDGAHLFKDRHWRLQDETVTEDTWSDWFERLNEQMGTQWTLSSLVARCMACGLAAALVGFFGNRWLSIVLAPIGMCLPLIILLLKRRRRQRKLGRQLPEAFQMISRAVCAGQTVPAAMQIVAQNFEPPIAEEFARCCEQQNLGISRESALKGLARRSGIMELQIFAVALLVQSKSGGDLVELLDNLSGMIRKRLKLSDRVRALTGEGRMQALVLTILPVVAFVGVLSLSPEYCECLLQRPWILLATVAAQLAGTLWVRKIVNFEY